jgi:phage baseplate assembly protein W
MDELRGFAFPFQIDPTSGGVRMTSGREKIRDNIRHILLTSVGERVMRRSFGGGAHQLLYDPNNEALRAIVQHQVSKTIGQWEPRVLVQEMRVTQENGTLMLQLTYVIRQTREQQAVSVPLGLGGF